MICINLEKTLHVRIWRIKNRIKVISRYDKGGKSLYDVTVRKSIAGEVLVTFMSVHNGTSIRSS